MHVDESGGFNIEFDIYNQEKLCLFCVIGNERDIVQQVVNIQLNDEKQFEFISQVQLKILNIQQLHNT